MVPVAFSSPPLHPSAFSRLLRGFCLLRLSRGRVPVAAKLSLNLGGEDWVEVRLEVGVEAFALVGFGQVDGERGDSQDGSADLDLLGRGGGRGRECYQVVVVLFFRGGFVLSSPSSSLWL